MNPEIKKIKSEDLDPNTLRTLPEEKNPGVRGELRKAEGGKPIESEVVSGTIDTKETSALEEMTRKNAERAEDEIEALQTGEQKMDITDKDIGDAVDTLPN